MGLAARYRGRKLGDVEVGISGGDWACTLADVGSGVQGNVYTVVCKSQRAW